MVATKPAAEVATTIEDQLKKDGGKNLTDVIEEVRKAQSDEQFMTKLNASLNDGNNDVLKGFFIEGADSDQKQLIISTKLANGRVVRHEINEKGERTNDIWGDPRNDREFTINEDGSASHTIRPGETVWSVTKDMLREKTGKEPTNAEVAKAVKDIEKHNQDKGGEIKDANLTKPGQKLLIPPAEVAAIKEARGEQPAKQQEEGKETETTSKVADKTYTVTRDAKGDATQVEITAEKGVNRVYKRNTQGIWEVDGKPAKDGEVAIGSKQNGVVRITDAVGGETTIYKNGTVSEKPQGGREKITIADGTTYTQDENGDYTKRAPDGNESQIAAANFKNENGVISDGVTKQEPPVVRTENQEAPQTQTPPQVAKNQARFFVGSGLPSNGVYNPIAPPGLAEANAVEEWDAETNYHPGRDANGLVDGDNWGVNSRKITKETKKDGTTETEFSGELDGYFNVSFTAKQTIGTREGSQGMVQSSSVEYGDTINGYGIELRVPNGRGGYDTIREAKKVDTKFDAEKNVYTTVITNQEGTQITYESDPSGKNTKFVKATGAPPINLDWEWKP